jgi:hypothetical protein
MIPLRRRLDLTEQRRERGLYSPLSLGASPFATATSQTREIADVRQREEEKLERMLVEEVRSG